MKAPRFLFPRLLGLLLGLLTLPVLASDKPTVAVLYFDYEGANAEMQLLKKGLAQMLISDLSLAHEPVQLVNGTGSSRSWTS